MAICSGRKTARKAEYETGTDRRRAGQLEGRVFYLDWREDGRPRTLPAGRWRREALHAWHVQCGLRNGDIEAEDERAQNGTKVTIDKAIEKCLIDIKATKGERLDQLRERIESSALAT
jgi:hypothetical protein